MNRWYFTLMLFITFPAGAWAQGQDSTPAERNLLILNELLPGRYDNANQNYFDRRRGLEDPDRHERVHTQIARVSAPAFGQHVFIWTNTVGAGEEQRVSRRLATLGLASDGALLVMRHYMDVGGRLEAGDWAGLSPDDLQRTEGCDYIFERRGEHFHGEQRTRACRFEWQGKEVFTSNFIEVSAGSLLWVDHKWLPPTADEPPVRLTGVASGTAYWLERTREFHCYADLPGVGGGRDEPFERYDDIVLHDKGGMHWFNTRYDQAREIGLLLQSVTWHILNEKDSGNFNRNSLVIYAMEKLADGSVKDHGYAFTTPLADRIGMNLKWMLVNCSVVSRHDARPSL